MCQHGGGDHRCSSSLGKKSGGTRPSRSKFSRVTRDLLNDADILESAVHAWNTSGLPASSKRSLSRATVRWVSDNPECLLQSGEQTASAAFEAWRCHSRERAIKQAPWHRLTAAQQRSVFAGVQLLIDAARGASEPRDVLHAIDAAHRRHRADDKLALTAVLNGRAVHDDRISALIHGEAHLDEDVLACYLDSGTEKDHRSQNLAARNWAAARGFADSEVVADVFGDGSLVCGLDDSHPRHASVTERIHREWNGEGTPSARALVAHLRSMMYERADNALLSESSKILAGDPDEGCDNEVFERALTDDAECSGLNGTYRDARRVGGGDIERATHLLSSSATWDEVSHEYRRLTDLPAALRSYTSTSALTERALRTVFMEAGIAPKFIESEALPPAAAARVCEALSQRIDGLGSSFLKVGATEYFEEWIHELRDAYDNGSLGEVAVTDVRDGYAAALRGEERGYNPAGNVRSLVDTLLLSTASREDVFDPSESMEPLFSLVS